MQDLISRQTAIDAAKRLSLGETDATRLAMRIGDYLERLPAAQPEIIRCKDCAKHEYCRTLKMIGTALMQKGKPMADLIERQAALDALLRTSYIAAEDRLISVAVIKALPTAQPPLEEFEWCTDCKEYDHERHCCHRFTKVIRQTVEELKVVRCKDCIHNNACEIQYAAQTGEWFYCGYGERGEKE